jgi:hypothetical protein
LPDDPLGNSSFADIGNEDTVNEKRAQIRAILETAAENLDELIFSTVAQPNISTAELSKLNSMKDFCSSDCWGTIEKLILFFNSNRS